MNKFIKNPFARKQKGAASVLCILFLTYWVVNAQPKLIWDFPVQPGTEEWNNLKTEKERVAAIQVPDKILAKATTEELVLLAVSFPLFGYYSAFNTPQDGFNIMLSRFNIIQSLFSKDHLVGKHLISIYKDAGMDGFEKTPVGIDFWTLRLHFVELLLSQPEIISAMTTSEKCDLLMETKKKIYQKSNSEAFSSYSSISLTAFIMVRVLDNEKMLDNENAETKEFLRTGSLESFELIEEISNAADIFIKNNQK